MQNIQLSLPRPRVRSSGRWRRWFLWRHLTCVKTSSRGQNSRKKKERNQQQKWQDRKMWKRLAAACGLQVDACTSVWVNFWLSTSPFTVVRAGGADVNVSFRGRSPSPQTRLPWALATLRSIPLGFSSVRFRLCELQLLSASSSNPLNPTQRSEFYSKGTCFFDYGEESPKCLSCDLPVNCDYRWPAALLGLLGLAWHQIPTNYNVLSSRCFRLTLISQLIFKLFQNVGI